MRFIIADDVYYARKAIEKLILEWDPTSHIIASCENGTEVLKSLQQDTPDALVLDIQMPGVDGLQLSEIANQTIPNIKVLLVTGFAEFEYARQAIRNEVFRYLLKPLKKEEFFDALNGIRSAMAGQAKWVALQGEMQRIANNYRISNFLSGSQQAASFYPLPELVLSRGYLLATLLCPGLNLPQLSHAIKKNFSSECFIYEDMFHNGRWILLAANVQREDLKQFVYGYLKDMDKLVQDIMTELNLNTVIGVSSPSQNPSHMPEHFLQSKRALTMRLITPAKHIFPYEESVENSRLFSVDNIRIFRHKFQADKEDEVFSAVCTKTSGMAEISLAQIEQLYHDMLGSALSVRTEKEMPYEGRLVHKPLWEFDNLQQVFDYFKELLLPPTYLKHPNDSGIIEEIKHFLHDNYYCDISLNELATTKYFMNPNYLSRLFKNREGIGFSKYLLNIRMEKSKSLLEDEKISISEIAALVGYTSSSYFIANFKKYHGCTPGALADMIKEKQP